MALPNTYQKLEYIESTGVQYIDIGYQPNYNTEIRAKFAHNEHTIDTPLFGVRGESSSNQFTLWTHPTLYSTNPAGIAIFNSTEQNLTNVVEGTIIEFEYSNTGGEYGSQTWTWTPSSGGPGLNMCLFGLNNNGTIDSRKFSGKLWYFQIYESGTLLMDLQPCYRKSDNEIGLYDLVNDVFYTNDGSGRFTKAPSKIQRIYIGENLVRPSSLGRTLVDDNYMTATDADLIAEGWQSVGQAYGLTTSSNGLHWVTMASDTASGVEFPVPDNLVGKKLCWELEGYAGTFTRWGNIEFSLDRPVYAANASNKYSTGSVNAGWGMSLWSLPGFDNSYNSGQYSGVASATMGYRDGNSDNNIDMYGDKGNKSLYWNVAYNSNYTLGLPYTTGIYKGRGYCDFANRINYTEWETPNGTIQSFSRDFSADDASKKASLNTWLAGTSKYIRLRSNRGYGNSSYDICYWRKAKIRYE